MLNSKTEISARPRTSNESQKRPLAREVCPGAAPSRCNCSGSRARSSVSGLIDQFEQETRIPAHWEPDSHNTSQTKISNTNTITTINYIRSTRLKRSTLLLGVHQHDDHNGLPSSPSSSSSSFDEINESKISDLEQTNDQLNQAPDGTKSTKETDIIMQQARKSADADDEAPSFRELTELRWQPATDANKYGPDLYGKPELRNRLLGSQRNEHARPTIQTIATTTRGLQHSTFPPARDKSVVNNSTPLSRATSISSERQTDYEQRSARAKGRLLRSKRSKRYPNTELAISELEQSNARIQEDQLLLDRAEFRDFPQRYYDQFCSPNNQQHQETQATDSSLELQEIAKLAHEYLERRTSVSSLEKQQIERAHLMYRPLLSPLPPLVDQNYCTPDRFEDDLAFRRLNNQQQHLNESRLRSPGGQLPSQSYLLCSAESRGSPSAGGSVLEAGSRASRQMFESHELDPEQLEWRLRYDDLHYRRAVRRKPDPHDPPFGIPRQPGIHSTASHYTRVRCQQAGPREAYDSPNPFERPDSRVSFAKDQQSSISSPKNPNLGRQSADSGLAIGSNLGSASDSPLTSSSQLWLKCPPRPTSQQCGHDTGRNSFYKDQSRYEQNDANNNELARAVSPSSGYSPAPERLQANYIEQPNRARPQIPLENPRSKSPLLRTSSFLTSTQQYYFKKREQKLRSKPADSSGPLVKMQTYEDSLRRRRRTLAGPLSSGAFSSEGSSSSEDNNWPTAIAPPSRNSQTDNNELECRFEFEDEIDPYDGFHEELDAIRTPDIRRDGNDEDRNSTSSQQERMKQFRSSSRASQYDEEAADFMARLSMAPRRSPNGAAFSISSYKSLDKEVKIL